MHDKNTNTDTDKYTKSQFLLINIKNDLNFSNINLIKTGFKAWLLVLIN